MNESIENYLAKTGLWKDFTEEKPENYDNMELIFLEAEIWNTSKNKFYFDVNISYEIGNKQRQVKRKSLMITYEGVNFSDAKQIL